MQNEAQFYRKVQSLIPAHQLQTVAALMQEPGKYSLMLAAWENGATPREVVQAVNEVISQLH